MRRHKLFDESWEHIKDLFPPEHRVPKGHPAKDNRQVVSTILWILRTGSPRRDLPEEYGLDFSDCNVLADKSYDSAALVSDLQSRNNTVVIPSRSNRKNPRDYDHFLYKERYLIECFFNKMKQYRRIATRYEKLASTYLAMVTIAASII